MIDSGRGTARAEDAQGTPTWSHKSTSILVYEEKAAHGSKCVEITTPSSSSSLLLSSLELSDTQVLEPYIRALLGTASHFLHVGHTQVARAKRALEKGNTASSARPAEIGLGKAGVRGRDTRG